MSGSDPPGDERSELFAYYDARAEGYEDFYAGRGQAIPALAAEYPIDTGGVSRLLSSFGRGAVVDLACGTGFWLTAYGSHCTSVTLVDQSPESLRYCQRRVDSLGLQTVAQIVRGDLFAVPLADHAYDACVLGFLLGHLTDSQVDALFDRLRRLLRPGAELAVIESVWSEARKPYCDRDSFERRLLPDGRAFMIRKKYYDRSELEALVAQHGFTVRATYVGKVFIGTIAVQTP